MSLGAEADAIEVSALGDESVGKGVTAFGLPLGPLAGGRMIGVNIVIAMWK